MQGCLAGMVLHVIYEWIGFDQHGYCQMLTTLCCSMQGSTAITQVSHPHHTYRGYVWSQLLSTCNQPSTTLSKRRRLYSEHEFSGATSNVFNLNEWTHQQVPEQKPKSLRYRRHLDYYLPLAHIMALAGLRDLIHSSYPPMQVPS